MAEPQEVVGMAFRGGVGSDPTGSGPLYPEGRKCRRPTARRLIDLFDDVQRHSLRAGRRPPCVARPDQDLTGGRIGLRRYG